MLVLMKGVITNGGQGNMLQLEKYLVARVILDEETTISALSYTWQGITWSGRARLDTDVPKGRVVGARPKHRRNEAEI